MPTDEKHDDEGTTLTTHLRPNHPGPMAGLAEGQKYVRDISTVIKAKGAWDVIHGGAHPKEQLYRDQDVPRTEPSDDVRLHQWRADVMNKNAVNAAKREILRYQALTDGFQVLYESCERTHEKLAWDMISKGRHRRPTLCRLRRRRRAERRI